MKRSTLRKRSEKLSPVIRTPLAIIKAPVWMIRLRQLLKGRLNEDFDRRR